MSPHPEMVEPGPNASLIPTISPTPRRFIPADVSRVRQLARANKRAPLRVVVGIGPEPGSPTQCNGSSLHAQPVASRSFIVSAAVAAALGFDKPPHHPVGRCADAWSFPWLPYLQGGGYRGHITLRRHLAKAARSSVHQERRRGDEARALAKAGQITEFVPIPLTVTVLKIGDKYVMVDAGSGAQWQPTAGRPAKT